MALNSLFIISLLNQGETARRGDSSSPWYQKAGLLSAGEDVISLQGVNHGVSIYNCWITHCWVCTSLGLIKCCPLWREREWLPLLCMNGWVGVTPRHRDAERVFLLSWCCSASHTQMRFYSHVVCVCVSSGLSTWTSPIWRQAPLLKLLSSIRWEKLMMPSGQDTKTLSLVWYQTEKLQNPIFFFPA